MTHTSFAAIIVVTTAYYLGAPDAAMAAEGKCTSIQAQCAVEMGGMRSQDRSLVLRLLSWSSVRRDEYWRSL
jgi:hypothetical protein